MQEVPDRPLGDLAPPPRWPHDPDVVLLSWIGSVILVGAAIGLFCVAKHYHHRYAEAHIAGDKAFETFVEGATPPAVLPASPEPFFRRAGYATGAILLVCAVALVLALSTRHLSSLVALVLCTAILFVSIMWTQVRY